MLATGSAPKSLPGLDIDGERVITSDARAEAGPGAQLGRSSWAAASSASSSPASGARSAPRSRSSRRCRTCCRPEEESSSKLLERAFRRRGIKFELGARFESVKHTDTGVIVTLATARPSTPSCCWSRSAAARSRPGLGFEEAGVEIERGFVMVDEYCRTSVPDVSAVGDLIPTLQLAHVGFAEGILVAEHSPGLNPRADRLRRRAADHLLRPRGRLGRHHLRAGRASAGIEIVEFTYDLAGNAKSQILQHRRARSRSSRAEGRPGRSASTWSAAASASSITEGQLIYNWEALPAEVAQLIHPHPTQSEAIGEAIWRSPASRCTSTTESKPLEHSERESKSNDAGLRTMPQLGESVTEGTVTRWLKKEGERVEADEPLLEVSTDKVDTEIPSPAAAS